jgi:hypothetical protein
MKERRQKEETNQITKTEDHNVRGAENKSEWLENKRR